MSCGCNNVNSNLNRAVITNNINTVNGETKHFSNAGICNICHPLATEIPTVGIASPIEDAGYCPPIGEPKLLTLMAPAVYDESGFNLCRTIKLADFVNACDGPMSRTTDLLFDGLTVNDLKKATHLQVQVVDIDFNFVCPKSSRFSDIKPAKNNPNISRVTLRDIDVTIAVKVIDNNCRVCKEGMMTLRYLPGENCPGYDEDTNPANVAIDLYTPYGVAFAAENPAGCNKLVPIVNYVGFVGSDLCQGCVQDYGVMPLSGDGSVDQYKYLPSTHTFKTFEPNNGLTQGISAQGLAKVISGDDEYLAIGLTLYFKVVYFVQYKFNHEGLCVPPKFAVAGNLETKSCLSFVEGDLLEQNILPLSVCIPPKSYS
ncbi:hypothetical protein [Candidatus Epulonipiscium viviparus]|uniref:hypothetical protein n=1 Tax=Candidatus Epulonipiscium viviparus TaxID=420336 RepID=UPI00016C09D0|nr:hypothetical protein [Candidatus Epulopiscium viviparus]